MRPKTPVQNSKNYAKNAIRPVRIIEDIDDMSLEPQNQSLIECSSRNLNIMRSYKDLKAKCVADIMQKREFHKYSNAIKKKSNANPNEGKKFESVDDDSDTNTVIENDCDNDYSTICKSLNKSRY